MNKVIVDAIVEKTGLKKGEAEEAAKAFLDAIKDELQKGEKVSFVGFGTFEVAERPARQGRNPQTGETMKISACKAPKFKAGKALKEAVNTKPAKKGCRKKASK